MAAHSLPAVDTGPGEHSQLSMVREARSFGPYLTTESAAEYLDFTGAGAVDNCRTFLRRHGVQPVGYRGDRPLFLRSDLDRVIGTSHKVPQISLQNLRRGRAQK
jgi:hypothetical protein